MGYIGPGLDFGAFQKIDDIVFKVMTVFSTHNFSPVDELEDAVG